MKKTMKSLLVIASLSFLGVTNLAWSQETDKATPLAEGKPAETVAPTAEAPAQKAEAAATEQKVANPAPKKPGKIDTKSISSTADHSKFEILQQDFQTGPEVTKACLSCHTEASDQMMHTIHYSWAMEQPETGQLLGKRHTINSFCGNVAGNEPRCTSCHTGYGWKDMRKDPPKDPNMVDCLACHDTSGQYTKLATKAGAVAKAPFKKKDITMNGKKPWDVDLKLAAQSAGKTSRHTCGSCHFYGGGGNNVKHGDLSSALDHPSVDVDVHMSKDGANMSCSSCHVQDQHAISGSHYATMPTDHPELKPGESRKAASCQSCHGEAPHDATSVTGAKINDHMDKVACQTCHIPTYAKGGVATKTYWDWSTAGTLKDGKPYAEKKYTQGDGKKLPTYMSKKGTFEWGEDLVPTYAWYDGTIEYLNDETPFDPSKIVPVNSLGDNLNNPDARIWPFKRMLGKQAYDTETNKLVNIHLFGPGSETAFWGNYDWGKSIQYAMDYVGKPYSGKYDFVETEMFWPITHMVAPADKALDCQSCHQDNGLMKDVKGVYMPGETKGWGFNLGILLLIGAALVVLVHAAIRLLSKSSRGA